MPRNKRIFLIVSVVFVAAVIAITVDMCRHTKPPGYNKRHKQEQAKQPA